MLPFISTWSEVYRPQSSNEKGAESPFLSGGESGITPGIPALRPAGQCRQAALFKIVPDNFVEPHRTDIVGSNNHLQLFQQIRGRLAPYCLNIGGESGIRTHDTRFARIRP
jgi:hypothetical protein